ncbi:MAG: flagellar export protein FliJ [Myxococcota bacterium]|jgi:flagellar export protein FliJ
MKRFVFRLESVLKLRRFELERRQRSLAAALARSTRIEAAIEKAGIAAAECSADLLAKAKQGASSGRVGLAQLVVERAFQTWRADQRSLQEANAVMEVARVEMTEAHTKVRALEKLKERALVRHREQSAREETIALDEVAGRMGAGAGPLARFASESRGSTS